MNPNMIDTLRYADRLKEAGVDARQAEAMSRALNDELAGNVATKTDLDGAVAELRAEMRAGFASVDARFEAVDDKIEALADTVHNMGQYTFLVLALVVALGLYNAVAPHFRRREAAPAAAAAADPQPEAAHPTDASARTPSTSRRDIVGEERGTAHASAGSHG